MRIWFTTGVLVGAAVSGALVGTSRQVQLGLKVQF